MFRSCSWNARVCRQFRTSAVGSLQRPTFNEFISRTPQKTDEELIGTSTPEDFPERFGQKLRSAGLQNVAVKDNITTSELPTTCASGILQSHKSPFEASCITQLRKHGAAVVGKTNLDEFGMGSHSLNSFFGPVQGHDGRSVGGSSGGSAAAVAEGWTHYALGTDTGGSVRLPAAFTGIVGFKPSYGLVSRWGVVPYANSLDTVGILASEVKHVSEVFPILRRHDPQDPTSVNTSAWDRMRRGEGDGPAPARPEDLPATNFKIGVPIEYNIDELDSRVRHTWITALEALQGHGCTIVPISLPNTKHALSAYYVLAPAEAASNLSKYDGIRYGSRTDEADGLGNVLYSQTRGEGFGAEVKRRIILGSFTLSSTAIDNYFIKAQKVRRLVQRDFDRVFALSNPLRPPAQFDLSDMDDSIQLEDKLGPPQVDMIICPTAPTPAPTIESVSGQSAVDTYMNDIFTVPASLAGLPALSLPCQISPEQHQEGCLNMVGLQILGQYGDDSRVIETARLLEALLPASRGLRP